MTLRVPLPPIAALTRTYPYIGIGLRPAQSKTAALSLPHGRPARVDEGKGRALELFRCGRAPRLAREWSPDDPSWRRDT